MKRIFLVLGCLLTTSCSTTSAGDVAMTTLEAAVLPMQVLDCAMPLCGGFFGGCGCELSLFKSNKEPSKGRSYPQSTSGKNYHNQANMSYARQNYSREKLAPPKKTFSRH